MFDINTISRRYFTIHLAIGSERSENPFDITLNIEPPTVKTLKRLSSIIKVKDEDQINELIETLKMILDKNKEGTKVALSKLEDLNFDEVSEILKKFFIWVGDTKDTPNL